MAPKIEKHYCERVEQEFVVERDLDPNIPCPYYYAGYNRYSMMRRRVCLMEFPKGKTCLIEERIRDKKIIPVRRSLTTSF